MKTISVSLAMFLSAGWLLAQETEWSTYSTAESKCEIKFPGKFTKLANQATLEAQGGKAVYLLVFNGFPDDIAVDNKDLVKLIFDNGRDATIKGFKGSKLLKETDTTIDGFPARELEVDAPNVGIYRGQFVLTPKVFYQIIVAGPKEFVDGADAKKFRESFKTTQKRK